MVADMEVDMLADVVADMVLVDEKSTGRQKISSTNMEPRR